MLSYILGHSHLRNLIRHKVEKHQNENKGEEETKDKPGNSVAIWQPSGTLFVQSNADQTMPFPIFICSPSKGLIWFACEVHLYEISLFYGQEILTLSPGKRFQRLNFATVRLGFSNVKSEKKRYIWPEVHNWVTRWNAVYQFTVLSIFRTAVAYGKWKIWQSQVQLIWFGTNHSHFGSPDPIWLAII